MLTHGDPIIDVSLYIMVSLYTVVQKGVNSFGQQIGTKLESFNSGCQNQYYLKENFRDMHFNGRGVLTALLNNHLLCCYAFVRILLCATNKQKVDICSSRTH